MASNKIVFLGDTHIGARKSSVEFHEYFREFFKEFFEYIDDNGIKTIVQVGDMFDVRNHVTTYAINYFKSVFTDEVQKRDITVYCLVGNHDAFYKEKVSLNTVSELIKPLKDPKFVVVDTPMEVSIGGKTFAMFPWICKETELLTSDLIKETNANIAVGHFEFVGFEYHKGTQSTVGRSHSSYSKFDLVISGHYHTASKKDNVRYTGTPYELTWVDYKDPKGFWVLDGMDMQFVQNSREMFKIFTYPEPVSDIDVRGRIVRLKVKSKDAVTKDFLKYKEEIESYSPFGDVKVIEVKDDLILESTANDDEQPTDIESLKPTDYVKLYLTANPIDADKETMLLSEVKDIFSNLEKSHDIF